MRIAQIAPLFEAVPPRRYGGTERVVHWLTEELVGMGHDVTLFATGDSRTSAKLQPMRAVGERFARNFEYNNAPYARMIELVRRQADDFDVLHFHIDFHPFSVFTRQPTPFVTTLHGRLDQGWVAQIYDWMDDGFSGCPETDVVLPRPVGVIAVASPSAPFKKCKTFADCWLARQARGLLAGWIYYVSICFYLTIFINKCVC